MDLLFVTILLLLSLIIFKSNVQSEQDSSIQSSASVETQYLTFDMAQYGTDGGVFSSPNFPDYYPRDIILFYQFKGSVDYRVQVEIDFFHVRGVPPQCTHDYLDVFLNITDFDLNHDQLLYRYCGRNKPPLLISLTNLLVLGFFTEDTQTERGFNGSFRFISAKPYRKNLLRQPCDYIFHSSVSKRGDLFTSTYPGTYLPWQFCNYSFIGQPNERIRIRFRDLMLFKTPNTQHCAVDLIKLYDNTLDPWDLQRFLSTFRPPTSPLELSKPSSSFSEHHISDLCGTYTMPLDVYSTGDRLLLYFISTHYAELTHEEQMRSDEQSRSIWRKGFYAEYEFLSSLTKLDFIGKNQSNEYLSGTECDQTIKSFSQGSGQIRSPNWPNFYKPQTSCTTYFLGLDDRYTLENVEIEFEQFDVDCQIASLIISNATRIYDHRFRTRPSIKTTLFSNYYQQELDFRTNLTFCGHFKPEGRFLSKNALLKISFIPNDYLSDRSFPSLIEGGRFLAKYKFVKSYHQVTADEYDGSNPSACSFFYYQSRTLSGKFQPPRSSENDYFSNANCTFEFHRSNEHFRLLIWFDYFNIADENYTHCPADNLTYAYRGNSSLSYRAHPFIYCGYRNFPPPYLTDRWTNDFRIHFRSNDDLDSGLGFDGRYQFINRSHSFFSSSICPTPFDPIIFLNETEQPSGYFSSQGYPENVICEWSYRTSEGFRFNLDLTVLQIEGSKSKDPPQGCQSAALRIYSEGRIEELCGTQENPFFFLTNSNWFTVQFLSFNRLTKEQLTGFNLSWIIVEIPRDRSLCSLPDHYIACEKTSNHIDAKLFCLHQALICNGSIECQALIDQDKLPSDCFERTSADFPSKSSRFLREHYLLISIIAILSIVILTIGTILIVLIIQSKRTHLHSRLTKTSLILRKHFDDQDSTGMSMLEQTVTTV